MKLLVEIDLDDDIYKDYMQMNDYNSIAITSHICSYIRFSVLIARERRRKRFLAEKLAFQVIGSKYEK